MPVDSVGQPSRPHEDAAAASHFGDLTIIVPTLDEAATIGILLEGLRRTYTAARVIVVDDGSSDGTQRIVRIAAATDDRVALLERRGPGVMPGLTASVIDGIRAAPTSHVLVMDADLQHPIAPIALMCERLRSGVDVVVAVRRPYRERQAPVRIAFTWLATTIARLVLRARGVSLADPMSGYFGTSRDLFLAVVDSHERAFEGRGYKVLFDFLRNVPRPLSVAEVPYTFGVRPGGHSKLRLAHALYFLRSLFR